MLKILICMWSVVYLKTIWNLLTSSMLGKGLLLPELSGTQFQHRVPIQGLFSWKLHQAGFWDILCSPRMKRCIPLALGVLSYLSPPGSWRSATSNSNFPLEMVERGNLKRLGTVWISCPNSLLFLKNIEVRVSGKSSCRVQHGDYFGSWAGREKHLLPGVPTIRKRFG